MVTEDDNKPAPHKVPFLFSGSTKTGRLLLLACRGGERKAEERNGLLVRGTKRAENRIWRIGTQG